MCSLPWNVIVLLTGCPADKLERVKRDDQKSTHIDIRGFCLYDGYIASLMTRNIPNRLNDGSSIESTDSNARQERSEEEEIPRANNNLTISD